MSTSSARNNGDETERPQAHPIADQDIYPEVRGTVSSLSEISMNDSADLEALNKILSEAASKINRLEGKLSATDEKVKLLYEKLLSGDKKFKFLEKKLLIGDEKFKTLEARAERGWVQIFPTYSMVFLTLGIAVFTGLLMWYLSKGTTDKTLTGTEEVIKSGFKTFNDFLSMYLSIAKERTGEETTTLVGSFITPIENGQRRSAMNE